MPEWLIALPVWGDAYRQRFVQACWPSWRVALEPIRDRVRIMLHTDDPGFADLFGEFRVCVRPPRSEFRVRYFDAFGNAHREALDAADPGELISLQNGDHVLSADCFTLAEQHFALGKKFIACSSMRTVGPLFGAEPPAGLGGRALRAWAVAHRHTITQQMWYPHGRSGVVSTLFFGDEQNAIQRAFHLHPFAVVKDRPLDFKCTVDRDLCDRFAQSEIHVATGINDIAMAEISPMGRRFPLRPDAMTPAYLHWWGETYASPMHWWFFRHRMIIAGDGNTDCDAPADDILARHDAREAA